MTVNLNLRPNQARALIEMARRWRFEDAQHVLRGSRGVTPDSLCEGVTSLLQALHAAETGSTTIDEGGDRITIALEVERTDHVTIRRFLEDLLAAAATDHPGSP
jgi:hypothetical protein